MKRAKRGNKNPQCFSDMELYYKIPKSVFADIAYNYALLMTGNEDHNEAIKLILKEAQIINKQK